MHDEYQDISQEIPISQDVAALCRASCEVALGSNKVPEDLGVKTLTGKGRRRKVKPSVINDQTRTGMRAEQCSAAPRHVASPSQRRSFRAEDRADGKPGRRE